MQRTSCKLFPLKIILVRFRAKEVVPERSIGGHLPLPMESPAERASYLSDAVIRGHYRQVKFYLDAGYDQDYIDHHREGKTKLKHLPLNKIF